MRRLRRLCRFNRVFVRRAEAGVVAVWLALMVPVFCGIAALALDEGLWHLTGVRVQKAADAAALAGVPNLPARLDLASTAAVAAAKRNGFIDGTNGVHVTATQVAGRPSQLQVVVSAPSASVFGGMLGVSQITISRTSVADYTGALQMGSPCNEYGQDPDPSAATYRSAGCNGANGMWGAIYGVGENKSDGDAFQAGGCDSDTGPTDGCVNGVNVEYDPNGYYYRVHVAQALAGNLQIEVFDPTIVNVGGQCELMPAAGSATDLRLAKNPYHPKQSMGTLTATDRYAPGVNSPYCDGDWTYFSGPLVNTTFAVSGPANVGTGAASFPLLAGCSSSFPAADPSNPDNLFALLNDKSAGYNDAIASSFRQWVSLCTITGPVPPGDYLIQAVTTNGGHLPGGNSFSLRAHSSLPAVDGLGGITVSGYGKMELYANTPNGSSDFYLTRLSAGARGKTLSVKLFDLGDGTNSGSYLQALPPPDSNVAAFSGCTGQGPATVQSNCRVPIDANAFNGRWQTLKIPIPANFTCDETQATTCWVRLHLSYAAGSQTTDETSWQASLDGDPVRLVQ